MSKVRNDPKTPAAFPFVEEAMVLDKLRGSMRAERLRYRRFVPKTACQRAASNGFSISLNKPSSCIVPFSY